MSSPPGWRLLLRRLYLFSDGCLRVGDGLFLRHKLARDSTAYTSGHESLPFSRGDLQDWQMVKTLLE